jgi:hypothetical protein
MATRSPFQRRSDAQSRAEGIVYAHTEQPDAVAGRPVNDTNAGRVLMGGTIEQEEQGHWWAI